MRLQKFGKLLAGPNTDLGENFYYIEEGVPNYYHCLCNIMHAKKIIMVFTFA